MLEPPRPAATEVAQTIKNSYSVLGFHFLRLGGASGVVQAPWTAMWQRRLILEKVNALRIPPSCPNPVWLDPASRSGVPLSTQSRPVSCGFWSWLDCVAKSRFPRFSECIRVRSERSSDTGLHPHNGGI